MELPDLEFIVESEKREKEKTYGQMATGWEEVVFALEDAG